MSWNLLERPRLIGLLEHQPLAHVLIGGPSGYGKTTLLEQYAQRVGLPVFDCETQSSVTSQLQSALARGEHMLLLDHAHLLSDDVVDELLQIDPAKCRLVLAVRHLVYGGVTRLLLRRRIQLVEPDELAFTAEELRQLGVAAGLVDSLLERTWGWPFLCVLELHPLIHQRDYLSSLYEELDADLQELVTAAATVEGWGLTFGLNPQIPRLLNTGFPIVPNALELELHPLMRDLILERSGQLQVGSSAEQDLVLDQLLTEKGPIDSRLKHVALFFDQGGDDDQSIHKKVGLLGSFPLERLSPVLRDIYAYYLLCLREPVRAESILLFQQDQGTASTRTFIFLARIASRKNELARYKEVLHLAGQHAANDDDWVRYYIEAAYYEVRQNDLDRALEHAQRACQFTRSGNVELYIFALQTLGNIQQWKGHLAGAIRVSEDALRLAESQGGKYIQMVALLHHRLGEMHKDMGDYEKALTHVQSGLNLQLITAHPEVPNLYVTRGLIYLETGQLEDAIESLQMSLEGFETDHNVAGTLIPRTFIVYALYRLGHHEAIYPHLEAIWNFVATYSLNRLIEPEAYRPLAEGVWHLSQGQKEEAVTALQQMNLTGTLTYDSVLLAQLILGELLVERQIYTVSDAAQLIATLDARHTANDATAAAYAPYFPQLIAWMIQQSGQPERFLRLAQKAQLTLPKRPQNTVTLQTLGQVTLRINNSPISSIPGRSVGNAPLAALAYLLYSGQWVTADQLGRQLFKDLRNSRKTAQQAVSNLRTILRSTDRELEKILSEKEDRRGYRVLAVTSIELHADFLTYLADFHPENPDIEQLQNLLQHIAPFLPGSYSPFALEINNILNSRTADVATHLHRIYLEQGDPEKATATVLHGLSFVRDPGLMHLLPAERFTALKDTEEVDDLEFTASVDTALATLQKAAINRT